MIDKGPASFSGVASRQRWLREYSDQVRLEHAARRLTEARWSWARLVTFGIALALWYPLAVSPLWAAGLSGALLLVFARTVVGHQRARAQRELLDRTLVVINEALQRCGGSVLRIRERRASGPTQTTLAAAPPAPILDDGPIWTLTDQERDDLDLFAAPVGIAGLLDRASTPLGRTRLESMLVNPCMSVEHISARQSAVRWLDDHAEQRLDMLAAAAVLRGQDPWLIKLIDAVRQAKPLPWPRKARAMRAWSIVSLVLTVTFLALIGLGGRPWVFGLLALFALNSALFARVRRELAAALRPWKDTAKAAQGYLHLARQAQSDLPEETILAQLRTPLSAVAQPDVLPSLSSRVAWADSGGAMHAFFNFVYFYDLHVASAILHRAVPHRQVLLDGLSAMGDLEALLSLACFAYDQPVRCYPQPADEPGLNITGGLHPLIPPERAVPNDVTLTPATHMWIVTGSNMAGKSTLLRMTGINTLLAQMGTVACAAQMTWTPVGIVSDLQVRDNLANDESYFLAEVRHLRRILLPDAHGHRILGLMDEPFRGTNSSEQVAASLAVTEHLIGSEHFILVATHEQRITELGNGSPAANYHFQENLSETGMTFDYRLRPGPAVTRNALRVLEREGYPAELMIRARQWLQQTSQELEAPSDSR